MPRKGCAAAPGFQRQCRKCRGRFAALSRRKAAPTGKGVNPRAQRWLASARRNASNQSNCSFEAGEQGLFIVIVLVGVMGHAGRSLKLF